MEKAATAIAKGLPFKDALLSAGYAATTARRTPADLFQESPGLKDAITQQLHAIDPAADEALIVATLRQIVVHGERDKTGQIAAAKLLGSHKKLQLWQPDAVIGIFQQFDSAPLPADSDD